MDNSTTPEQINQLTLTPSAAQAITDLLTQQKLEGYSLRVFVQGGGCSGFQYGMAFDNRVRDADLVLEQHGVKMLIDEVSILYLDGATIDYIKEPTRSGFMVTNPNRVSGCNCGGSCT